MKKPNMHLAKSTGSMLIGVSLLVAPSVYAEGYSKQEHGSKAGQTKSMKQQAVRSGSGTIVEMKRLNLRDQESDHLVAKVKVNAGPQKGKMMLLDFGDEAEVDNKEKLSQGNTINFSGRPGRINKRPVLMVTGFNAENTPVFQGFEGSNESKTMNQRQGEQNT